MFNLAISVTLLFASTLVQESSAATCVSFDPTGPYNIFKAGNHTAGWRYSPGSGGASIEIDRITDVTDRGVGFHLTAKEGGFDIASALNRPTACVTGRTNKAGDASVPAGVLCSQSAGAWSLECASDCGLKMNDCTLTWRPSSGEAGCAEHSGSSISTATCSGSAGQKWDVELAVEGGNTSDEEQSTTSSSTTATSTQTQTTASGTAPTAGTSQGAGDGGSAVANEFAMGMIGLTMIAALLGIA